MKNIKYLLSGLLLLFCATSLLAQDSIVRKHELRVGIGLVPFYVSNFNSDHNGYYDSYYPGSSSRQNFYYGDRTFTPSFFVGYAYPLSNRFVLGASVYYAGVFQKQYDLRTDAVIDKLSYHYFGIMPSVRYNWRNRKSLRNVPTLQLYSSFGIGVGFQSDKSKFPTDSYGSTQGNYSQDNSTFPILDLTPIGVSVGKDIFGFAEVSVGMNGFFKFGMGYRFK